MSDEEDVAVIPYALDLLARYQLSGGWAHARWGILPPPKDERVRLINNLELSIYVAPRRWPLLAALGKLPDRPRGPWILFPVGDAQE